MHIIVFGDSIAQGFFDTETGGWVTLLSSFLQKKTIDSDFETYSAVFNQSISGESTVEITSRFKNEINSRLESDDKNVIIFAGGINDAKRLLPSKELYVSVEETVSSVRNFIEMAKEITPHVYAVGSIRVNEEITTQFENDTFQNADIEEYDQAIEKCVGECGVKFIPMSDLLKLEHLVDGLHPNAEGHRQIFKRVKEALEAEGVL